MARPEFEIPYAPHPAKAAKIAPLIDGRHPQEAFHWDRYHVTYRAAFAGTGGGKTAGGAFELISWMLENPRCVCLAGEPDFPMIQRVMIPALEDLLGSLDACPLVASYNKTDHRLELKNGAVCWFVSLEKPEKLEGPNVDFVWLDEIRLIRKWRETWQRAKRRLRGSRPGMRIGAVVTTHSPTKEQSAEFEGATKQEARRCYRWSSLDNPLLPADYLRELEASHGKHAYKAVVLGEFSQPEGRVLGEFVTTRDVRARPDPPLAERPTGYLPWAQRVSYGVDWGHGAPACIMACAWGGETAHFVEEVYGTGYLIGHSRPEDKPRDLIEEAKRLVSRWGPGKFYCGHDQPASIQQFISNGLEAVSIQQVKGAFVIHDGLSVMDGMFRSDELRVAPECKNWLYEEEHYAWEDGKEGKVIGKSPDHAIDASRYAVMGERARPRLVYGTVSRR